jgi:hypothetical protein
MRPLLLALLLPLAACAQAPVPRARTTVPAVVESARVDLESRVVERFGAAALARARSAPEFIAVLRYSGLPAPPYDTDGHPIKPSYPTALLFRENGRWFAYGMNGVRPILPRWSGPLDELLQRPDLWAEPVDGGLLGCTDAGASYVWLRVRGHAEQARIGHCGGSPLTERLVSAALMG